MIEGFWRAMTIGREPNGRSRRKLLVGSMLAALTLAGCEEAQQRADNFEQLSEQVSDQISQEVLGVPTDQDLLAAASVEDRAIGGDFEPTGDLADLSLEEALQTQAFFAVGSVIAKPKENITTFVAPVEVVDEVDAEFDAALEDYEALQRERSGEAVPDESAGETAEATAPVEDTGSVEKPVEQAETFEPPVPTPITTSQIPPNGSRPAASRRALAGVKRPVISDVEDSIAEQLPEAGDKPRISDLRQMDRLPKETIEKFESMPDTPGPRVRRILKTDKAADMRERTRQRLERLGLPGEIFARNGGEIVIQVDVGPTRYDIAGVEAYERFARSKALENGNGVLDCESESALDNLKKDAALATRCVVEILRESDEYEYVEEDFIFTHELISPRSDRPTPPVTVTDDGLRPNDPLWSLQWHFQNLGSGDGESEGGSGFADFWDRTRQTGSKSVTVAVIDTGVDMDHPDIKGSSNLAPGFDMVSDPFIGNDGDGRDSNPNDPGDICDPSDPLARDTFHGTHVAGTVGVAATNNSAGVAGGAWNVTIVPVRALGRCGGQLSDINDAIRWAAGVVPARDDLGDEIWNRNPADVINLSIGLFQRCPASLQEAINDATAAGAVVVAAAGNARVDTRYYAPGGCDNVISVAAGDGRGTLTYYSNFGDDVDILAPGGDMRRDDDSDGRPDGVLSTKRASDCVDPVTKEQVETCFYAYENGTSMAAPHVAAALALLKSEFPTATTDELKTRLLNASTARTEFQCSGRCSQYPGSVPIEGSAGLCFRPCGGATLDLSKAETD